MYACMHACMYGCMYGKQIKRVFSEICSQLGMLRGKIYEVVFLGEPNTWNFCFRNMIATKHQRNTQHTHIFRVVSPLWSSKVMSPRRVSPRIFQSMYPYIRTCIHTHMYIYIHIFIYVYIHLCVVCFGGFRF
jgi:hypothetical protein